MAKDFCKKIDKPYILVFNVKPVKSLIDFAEKLSKKTEIPVVYITDNPQKSVKISPMYLPQQLKNFLVILQTQIIR